MHAIAAQEIDVLLAHVPARGDPFDHHALAKPGNVELLPLSHRLGWPLHAVHSNRIFFARLMRHVNWSELGAVFTRHLKLARSLLERVPGLPLVYEAHEVFSETAPPARREQIAALERLVVQGAAALVANSQATARRLTDRHAVTTPVHVIPNGVDYPPNVSERDWTRAAQNVVYAGSFFGWKGVDDLVTAAATLPGFRVRLIGGDEASVARLRAHARGDGAQLEFTGRVPHDSVARELETACIAVLPNRADTDSTFTSPIKLFEYMAAGCAIVASDIPALREILDDADALWVPPGQPQALADGIRALAESPAKARAMGARVREKARRYTWHARGEKLAAVLKPLMTR